MKPVNELDWHERKLASQAAYLEGVHNASLAMQAKDNDPARVAAYKELLEQGETEAANMALRGSER